MSDAFAGHASAFHLSSHSGTVLEFPTFSHYLTLKPSTSIKGKINPVSISISLI